MVAVNVTPVLPAGIVTEAGTVAAPVLLLVNVTTIPAGGAGPVRVTVPVEFVPPVTVVGLRLSAFNAGRDTVNVAERVVPP